MPFNSGSTWCTGVSSATFASSTSIMKATEVTGFVMDAMRNSEPSSTVPPFSRAVPIELKWTT